MYLPQMWKLTVNYCKSLQSFLSFFFNLVQRTIITFESWCFFPMSSHQGNTHEILSSLAFEEKWKRLSGSLHAWEGEHENFYGSFSWVDTCGIFRSITYGFYVEEKKTLPFVLLQSLSVELRRFDFDIVLRSYRSPIQQWKKSRLEGVNKSVSCYHLGEINIMIC